ncbi:hypothetical protein GCM10022243_43060 [Saccharothrix violaceirubra]|uniref:Geranylgeranyl transferase type II subunit beta n=1 Tax=Saccharothrix violaceirubra TaxID=413306 RepID=A0A7W7T2X3_9PSEU|nr:prenyltransferase/squalene oxidase repeat-containing protein [Saccharothrix violaceirubra]MBB4965594.1 prenyltransferase beta subunit [Saccharothrix violaceirubra]
MTAVDTTPRAPGGLAVSGGEADLWCTYAATRTLAWLGRVGDAPGVAETAAFLAGKQNADGGYAWSKGMASDAWATFYCAQALADLGADVPRLERTARWLRGTWTGDAYAMMPGQAADVWATHFSVRTVVELCRADVPDRRRLLDWLRLLQTPDGGLGWSPEHARYGRSDVRACFYGVMAWRALRTAEPDLAPPWDVPALLWWLRDQQGPDGGFRFGADARTPCMWATYRATAALDALGAGPRDRAGCLRWIEDRRTADGAFVRWAGYDVADVWASFCAVGSLRALGADTGVHADPVVARVRELACPDGGFTYREPEHAGDALSTAAAVLGAEPDDPRRAPWRQWLAGCRLPNEGGVMYMPARGSEVRCTLWALAAGACADDPAARGEIADWLRTLQNTDGGFGYWEGRASDLVSTSAAVEILRLLDIPVARALDTRRLVGFVEACRSTVDSAGFGHVPGSTPTLRAGLQAQRVLDGLGRGVRRDVVTLLDRHRVAGGGFANEGARMPDLLSGYEAVATADRFDVEVDTGHLATFLDRVRTPTGTAWTPLAPVGGGPLADCLARLLRRRAAGGPTDLPALTLS